MYGIKKIKYTTIILGLLSIWSASCPAMDFYVYLDNAKKFKCNVPKLTYNSGSQNITLSNQPKCTATSESVDFSKSSPYNVKSVSVNTNSGTLTFGVIKMYGTIKSDNTITKPTDGTSLRFSLSSDISQLPANPEYIPPTSGNVKIIEVSIFNETHLPGCAYSPNTQPNDCRKIGSIDKEIFALKLNTTKLAYSENQLRTYTILGTASIGMELVNGGYKQFLMSVSTTPGEFINVSSACKSGPSGDTNISVMSTVGVNERTIDDLKKEVDNSMPPPYGTGTYEDYNKKRARYEDALRNYQRANNNFICLLDPSKQYYINVKPENSGCYADVDNSGTLTKPNGPCRYSIYTQLPR